jgi:enoyl-CoA hydratase
VADPQELVVHSECDGVVTLTLNRPRKRNALSVDLFVALDHHLDLLEHREDEVGVVVLRGAGGCFSAGADLSGPQRKPRPHFQAKVIDRLDRLPQPVIAAVDGICFTGGLELALAADLIVGTRSSRFADTHARFALTPGWGMSQRLPRRVGAAKARLLMYTGRVIEGTEAEAMGLIDVCSPDEDFERDLGALVTSIAANSWFSHRGNKRLLRETEGMTLAEGLAHETYNSPGVGPDHVQRRDQFFAPGRPAPGPVGP